MRIEKFGESIVDLNDAESQFLIYHCSLNDAVDQLDNWFNFIANISFLVVHNMLKDL